MSGLHPILLCSECGIVGATDSAAAECPNCGSKSLNRPRQASLRPLHPRPKFHTASRLRLDVENNSLTVDVGERVCLIDKCANLVDRLCITALLPERHGGFGSRHVIIIDAGNSSDIYSCVNIARQYGLNIRYILRRIVVSRPFTIYQLTNLVVNELPEVIQKFDTKVVIIPDMLRMFLNDPSVSIGEAQHLIKQLSYSTKYQLS